MPNLSRSELTSLSILNCIVCYLLLRIHSSCASRERYNFAPSLYDHVLFMLLHVMIKTSLY
jgi:hypothetical protein